MMYMHVRQTAIFADGSTREAGQDSPIAGEPPRPDLGWKDYPVAFHLLRDVLLDIAPLKAWQIDDSRDAFQGVTIRFIGKHLCKHGNCPTGMEFRAWIDEHAEQSALRPEQEQRWREKLSFLGPDS